ncbi:MULTISPECIES: hypothetical protein [Enterobacter]|uniref:hypothetical protein n=1 Tax=Enterobacter TaxID=547 RepID=UPI000643249C|nr:MULTISPECIES: hypothetical protein [Enterobacter]KLP25071.1 hypothetical protein YA51_17005 [Enterobacter kobei]KLR33905.1 hypothetical protein ABR25_14375 [Enterobacter kobei]MDU4457158.1 hypothetical protein [Enterobacter sp.]MEB6643479.1 hypothetical protein [Enterobacter kobei]HEM8703428.1 hypothetical protein [Enterobacter kobei]
MPVYTSAVIQNQCLAAFSQNDLECLEHLRNVGQFVGDMMQEQESKTLCRDPAHQSQLASVIYLMTSQLDAVVDRCGQRWLTGEADV